MGVAARLRRVRPGREALLRWAVVLNTELLLVLLYLAVSGQSATDPLFYAWPFVWLNAAVWAVGRVELPEAGARASLLAGAVGAVYLLVLGYFGGLYAFGGAGTGFRLATDLPPGWGPAPLYSGTALTVALVPFKLVGYGVLAYLVVVTLLDAGRSAWSGLVGLLSCVSCSWPLVGALLAWVFGSASAAGAVAFDAAYPLSTLAYLSAVALLVWRPTAGGRLAG